MDKAVKILFEPIYRHILCLVVILFVFSFILKLFVKEILLQTIIDHVKFQ